MKTIPSRLQDPERFSFTLIRALSVGCLVIAIALLMKKSGNPYLWQAGYFVGGIGNDLFLIGTNLLIVAWAWRQRLWTLITLTLSMDFIVWVSVQGIKLLKIDPWYMRPNGGTGGFPSGHATHAFAMAFLLTWLFPRFAWLWYALAVVIAWSRIENDWHTGVQVAAGVVLGISIAWAMISRWLRHAEALAEGNATAEKKESVAINSEIIMDR